MRIRIIFIPLFLLLSCSTDQDKNMIISEEKMIDILVDVQISETYYLNKRSARNSDFKVQAPEYFNFIFEKHQITKPQFDESMKFYQKDLPTFKMLYDSVAVRLEKMEKEL